MDDGTPNPAGGASAAPAAPQAPTHAVTPAAQTPAPAAKEGAPAAPEPKTGDTPPAAPAAPAEPDAAGMRAYLAEKTADGKTPEGKTALDGKTDADIADLYKALKTKEGAEAPAFKIPDEYKDRPWASKIKSQDDLFKQLDNLDKAVGKKQIPPDLAKATPEEREAFYAQLRPKDGAEYQFTKDIAIDPAIEAGVRDILMKNGISKVQGDEIIKMYQTQEQAKVAEMFAPDGMKAALETAFGKDWQKVTSETRTLLKGVMSPEDNARLDALPNPYLSIIYRTLGNITKAYGITETNAAHFQAAGGVAPSDINAVRQGLRDQINALSMKPHSAADVTKLVTQLNDTYKNDPRLKA